MKDLPENELLSAYLDGELTADEQAEVEQLLSRSPAARQLLDELRTLSSTLQSLPQYKLAEDLSQWVLRIAQRRILTEPAEPGELPKPAPPTGTEPAPSRRAILRRVFNSRALAWSALTVAVAIMLTVFSPGPKDDEVALAPPEAANKVADTAESGLAREGEHHRDRSAPGEAEPAVERVEESDGGAPADGLAVTDGPAPEKGLLQRSDKGQPSPEGMARKAEEAPARDGPGGPPDDAPESGFRYADKLDESSARGIATDSRARPIGKDGAGYGTNGAGGGSAGLGMRAEGLTQVVNGPQVKLAEELVPSDGPYAVVYCDISPEAFQGQTFDHLLKANGIALEGAAVAMDASGGPRAYAELQRAVAQSGERPEEQKQVAVGTTLAYLPQPGKLDLVCVRATPAQIEGTLDALRVQTGEFLSVAVDPAPGVEAQRDWGRKYGRRPEPKARQAGDLRTGQEGDSPETPEARVSELAATVGQRVQGEVQGVEVKGRATQGRAWRLPLRGPSRGGGLKLPAGGYAIQSGAAGQQPDAEIPVASPPAVPPPPAEKPPAEPSPAGDRSEKPPDSDRRPAESTGQGERLNELQKAGSAEADLRRRTAVQRGKSQTQEAAEPGKSGTAGLETAPAALAPKGQQGGRSQSGAGRKASTQDQAKTAPEPDGEQEFRQQQSPEQPLRPAVTYQVLFVLRMVGPNVSNMPAAREAEAGQVESPSVRAAPAKK